MAMSMPICTHMHIHAHEANKQVHMLTESIKDGVCECLDLTPPIALKGAKSMLAQPVKAH